MPENTELAHSTATLEPMTDASSIASGLLFEFPVGLPGFVDVRAFQLLPMGPEFGPYLALKAAGKEHPIFVVAQPGAISEGYDIEIDDASQALLGLESAENVLVLVIVTLRGEQSLPAANLAAPIVVNLQNMRGCQVLQTEADISQMAVEITTPVFDAARAAG